MQYNNENKLETKQRLINFYNSNKIKIYSLIIFSLVVVGSIIFIKYLDQKKNIQIAEKYIKANLLLASDENEKAKKSFEEIILSNNEFYSILALNTIVEKKLISDEKKILEYFKITKANASTKNQKDLITFKQALYLIKNSETEKGNVLLEKLISNESEFKSMSQELLKQ